jgi:hypothetical protein
VGARRLPLGARGGAPAARRGAVGALVVVLLLATAAAFAVAERLKLSRAPVTAPRFTRLFAPACACARDTARLQVRLREPATLDVSIVDAAEEHVRTLATGLGRPRGTVRFAWDGRDDAGDVVRDGRYRLRLHLREEDRTIVVPTPVRVDATPPRVELLSAKPPVISPDGDGRADRVVYRYGASEAARALVYVEGRAAVRGLLRPAGPGRVRWQPARQEGLRPPGPYTTWLTAVDPAGNESERSRALVVRVRYVDVRERRIETDGRALAFTVDADARKVAWALRSRRGRVAAEGDAEPGRVSVRLPERLRPGRYVLTVGVRTEADRASVVVRG